MGLCHVLSAVLYPRWKTSAFTCAMTSDYTSRSIGVNKLCRCTDFLSTKQFAVVWLWVESSPVSLWCSWATSVNVYVIPQRSIRKLASEVAARAKSTAVYAPVNSSWSRNSTQRPDCKQLRGEILRPKSAKCSACANRVKAELSGVLLQTNYTNSSGPTVVELRHRHALFLHARKRT